MNSEPPGSAGDAAAPACRIAIRLTPRASRTAIAGVRNGALQVRVNAPPVDDRANQELIRLLAKRLGVPRRSVTILKGHHSRDKLIRVAGITPAQARAALQ